MSLFDGLLGRKPKSQEAHAPVTVAQKKSEMGPRFPYKSSERLAETKPLPPEPPGGYKKVFVDIGAGADFKRAQDIARAHPGWLVFAVDPNLDTTDSPLPNLVLKKEGVSPRMRLERGGKEYKADRVEMNYLSVPFGTWDNKPSPEYKPLWDWLIRNPSWLNEKSRVEVRIYPEQAYLRGDETLEEARQNIDKETERFKQILGPKGFKVSSKVQFVKKPTPVFKNPDLEQKSLRIPTRVIPSPTFYGIVNVGNRISFFFTRGSHLRKPTPEERGLMRANRLVRGRRPR